MYEEILRCYNFAPLNVHVL